MFQMTMARHRRLEKLAKLDVPIETDRGGSGGSDSVTQLNSQHLWTTCLRVIDILIKRKDYVSLDCVLAWCCVIPYVIEVPHRRRLATHLYISNALQVGNGESAMEAMRQIEKEVSAI